MPAAPRPPRTRRKPSKRIYRSRDPPKENAMHRQSVKKASSARQFNKKAKRTHPKNMSVMRGGYRL